MDGPSHLAAVSSPQVNHGWAEQGGAGQLGSSRGGGDQRVGSIGSPGAESAQRLSLEAEGLGMGAGVTKLKTLEAGSSVRVSPVWLLD